MTNQQHPITPPPELVMQWRKSGPADAAANNAYEQHIATQAARWGADQELKACVEWVVNTRAYDMTPGALRAARRPKPLSLKEQALTALHAVAAGANDTREQHQDLDTIRRALEQLDD